jgi:hypothetical protein
MIDKKEFDYWYRQELFSDHMTREAVITQVVGQKSGYLYDLVESIIADSWSHGDLSWGYLKEECNARARE